MPIVDGKYVNYPRWENNAAPALDEDELNAMSDTLEKLDSPSQPTYVPIIAQGSSEVGYFVSTENIVTLSIQFQYTIDASATSVTICQLPNEAKPTTAMAQYFPALLVDTGPEVSEKCYIDVYMDGTVKAFGLPTTSTKPSGMGSSGYIIANVTYLAAT